MLILLSLLLASTPPRVGSVHVLVEPGDAIFLDGTQVGVSSVDAGGLVVENVPAGDHVVNVRTPSGGSVTMKVNVAVGLTSRVTISSLGLRTRARGNDSSIEIQVPTEALPCELTVGNDRVAGSSDDLRIDHVHPGHQKVTIACGGKHASADIDVPAGKTLTVHADVATGKMTVINERPRVTSVYVPTVEDAIMRLDLPFKWKRAIAASLVAGVKPESITRNGVLRVDLTLVAPSYAAAMEVGARLKDRPEVATVYHQGYDYDRRGRDIRYAFVVTFRENQ